MKLYKLLKILTPKFIKKIVKSQINKFIKDSKISKDKKFFCPTCKNFVAAFDRLADFYFEKMDEVSFIHSIFQGETLNLLNYSCPICGASDRDRLYSLFLEEKFKDNTKEINVVDFSPAKSLAQYMKSLPNINYRSADLLMDNVDDNVDISDMSIYENELFDVFICSHILEHIEDDIKAMKELYRILKENGWGILMVPINLGLSETYENPEITCANDRWKHFGQNDHVRMYSKNGFIERVKSVGFKIKEYGIKYFGKDIFEKHGIHKRSILYIVEK